MTGEGSAGKLCYTLRYHSTAPGCRPPAVMKVGSVPYAYIDGHSDLHHTTPLYGKGAKSIGLSKPGERRVAPDPRNNFTCSCVILPLRKNDLALCHTNPSNPHVAEGFLPEDQEALTACQAPYRTAKLSSEGNTWRIGPLPHISPSCIAGGRRIQGTFSLFAFFLPFLRSLSTQFPFGPWGKRGPSCQAGAAASWPGYPKGMSWDDEMYFFLYSPSTAPGMKAPTRNGLPKPGTGSSPSFSEWAFHPRCQGR